MAINISVQYNGGLLPDIILLTQGYYPRGTSGFVFTAYYVTVPGILLLRTMFDDRCTTTLLLFLLFFWCPCVAINVSVHYYNGGLLPDIILLTQCYYHRETRLNVMKLQDVLYLQPTMIPPKRFDSFPP